jgi:hypothetical protein
MLLAELTGDRPDYGYAVRLGIIAAVLVAAPSPCICCIRPAPPAAKRAGAPRRYW